MILTVEAVGWWICSLSDEVAFPREGSWNIPESQCNDTVSPVTALLFSFFPSFFSFFFIFLSFFFFLFRFYFGRSNYGSFNLPPRTGRLGRTPLGPSLWPGLGLVETIGCNSPKPWFNNPVVWVGLNGTWQWGPISGSWKSFAGDPLVNLMKCRP